MTCDDLENGVYNPSFFSWDQVTFNAQWGSEDDDGVFTPIDLTNYTAVMQVRKEFQAPVFTLTIGSGLEIPTPANGTVEITISQEQMATLENGEYLYSLQLVSPTSVPTTILSGVMTVKYNATQEEV